VGGEVGEKKRGRKEGERKPCVYFKIVLRIVYIGNLHFIDVIDVGCGIFLLSRRTTVKPSRKNGSSAAAEAAGIIRINIHL